MFPIKNLSRLRGIARIRKCALLLEKVELDLSKAGEGGGPAAAAAAFLPYVRELCAYLASAPDSSPEVAAAANACIVSTAARDDLSLAFRAINDFRHILMRISGQAPADWDLHDFRSIRSAAGIAPNEGTSQTGETAARAAIDRAVGNGGVSRSFIPGVRVYLEDIRSPFNVGTIMRTAEAFGFEEVLLSPDCADPRHPRAARSSMGAVDMIPWRRAALAELPPLGPIFALELGGTALAGFTFPARGVLILGSEELGVSAPALALADAGPVSIPMRGIKASINVAVAFGIAAQAWVSAI